MRVWEYVQCCLCDLYFCAIIALIWGFQCVLAGKAFFSHITNFDIFDVLNVCNISVFMCNIKFSKCIYVFYIVQASGNLASRP